MSTNSIMPRAWILVYEHPPGTGTARMNRLHHLLFGYRDRSNHGRYEYERKGLLSGKPFLRLRRGVVAIPLEVGEAARLLVEAEKARVWLRRVELDPEDEEQMARMARDQGIARRGHRRVRRATRPSRK